MKKILLNFSLLLFGLSINACVEKAITPKAQAPIIPPKVVTTPPPVVAPIERTITPPSSAGKSHQLKTVQGELLTVQERSNGFVFPQYKNKIVLLQLFGQDCEYCFKEMPIINNIKKKYANNLQVIAIQAQKAMSKERASRLIQQFQMNYPIIDQDEAMDLLYFLKSTYNWNGVLPYILLLKNGVTEYSFSGSEATEEALNYAIKGLI